LMICIIFILQASDLSREQSTGFPLPQITSLKNINSFVTLLGIFLMLFLQMVTTQQITLEIISQQLQIVSHLFHLNQNKKAAIKITASKLIVLCSINFCAAPFPSLLLLQLVLSRRNCGDYTYFFSFNLNSKSLLCEDCYR